MKLALGSVQFGLPYGARKRSAAVSGDEVRRMLAWAWSHDIDLIDTAPAYGNAEAVIAAHRPANAQFEIVTKLARISDDNGPSAVLDAVRQSFELNGGRSLWGVLVHHAPDLLGPGGDSLFNGLSRLRDEGVTRRVGVSVYDPETLASVLARFPVEVVQLPLNVLDQRFMQTGSLDDLARRGIEVHVRSIFLQGMLLVEPAKLPAHLQPARRQMERLRRDAAEAGIDPGSALFGYARTCNSVGRVVIGADSVDDLMANVEAFAASDRASKLDFSRYAVTDPSIIDPRAWPS